jgi:hypothetical protein
MTADRSADAAVRETVRGWFALWYPPESVDPQTDGFMEHLAAAGFEIRERRSETVADDDPFWMLPINTLRDWHERIETLVNRCGDGYALASLIETELDQAIIARATGDGETT